MSSKYDIFDEITYTPKNGSSGDIFDEIAPKKSNKTARNVMQGAIGAGKGAAYVSPAGVPLALGEFALPGAIQNVMAELLESDIEHQALFPGEFPKLDPEALKKGASQALQDLTGGEGFAGGLVTAPFRAAGIDTAPEDSQEKAIRGIGELFELLRGGTGLTKEAAKRALGGALTGEATKEGLELLGVPEEAASIAALGPAARTQGSQLLPRKKQTSPSGLTKPRAVESKFAEKGLHTKEQQKKIIGKLDKEASELTKKSVERNLPISKQIEDGFDFHGKFERDFGQVKKLAEKADPDVNVSELSKFFSETADKYRGIPNLHPQARKIANEIKAFRKNPARSLNPLLKTYRSNVQKMKDIYETSRLTGKQQEYVDFLSAYNRNIAKSFEKTLPEDSAWLKQFKDLNKEYHSYINAQKTLQQLQPLLGGKVTTANLERLGSNKKLQDRLALSMGKEGAKEIVQIAKDLKAAREAIKRIPRKEISNWDQYLPLSILIPGHHGVGALLSAKKLLDWSKRGYGFLLSRPSTRKAYMKALSAIEQNNLPLYIKAAEELQKSLKD
jgi:hypothetical protein